MSCANVLNCCCVLVMHSAILHITTPRDIHHMKIIHDTQTHHKYSCDVQYITEIKNEENFYVCTLLAGKCYIFTRTFPKLAALMGE